MVIVANIVIPLVRENSQQISIDTFTLPIQIKEVTQWTNDGLLVVVNREVGVVLLQLCDLFFMIVMELYTLLMNLHRASSGASSMLRKVN